MGEGTKVRFYQTLQNYLKVSVGNDTYNLTKYDKLQITDTTIFNYPNSGRYLLQRYNIKCNVKNGNGKIQNFTRSRKTNSSTGFSGATSLPPIRDLFKYIKRSQNISGSENIFVSFERTEIFHINNITFYYNRISNLNI